LTSFGKLYRKKKNLILQNDIVEEFAGCSSDDSDDDDFDEVDHYINTKISFSRDDALLEWWSKHSLLVPQLSLLAKSELGVPASSATSERVFS